MSKKRYGVKGMMCAACVSHVERAALVVLKDKNASCTVSLLTNSMSVVYPDEMAEREILKIEKELAKIVKEKSEKCSTII